MILSFIVSKEGKLLDPKKNTSSSKHATAQESTTYSSIQWDGVVLQMFYKKLCCYYATYH
jgi:hypothetical protein